MSSIFQETFASRLKDRVRDSRFIRVIRPTRALFWRCQDYALDQFAAICPRLSSKLLVVSIPKAGLHLLTEALGGLREVSRRPLPLPNNLPVSSHRESFRGMARNRFAHWHYGATPETLAMAEETDASVIVVLRDPRDIVVSFVDYVCHLEAHVLHRYYQSLPDLRERMKQAILGVPKDLFDRDSKIGQMRANNPTYPGISDIGEVCRSYLAWQKHLRTHFVYFEDLVGERGGGDGDRQFSEMRKLMEFLKLNYTDRRISRLCAGIYNPGSQTFNKGVQGRWKSAFTDETKDLFKMVAAKELVRMGYEKDDQW